MKNVECNGMVNQKISAMRNVFRKGRLVFSVAFLIFHFAQAQQLDPLVTSDSLAQDKWVASKMKTLSLNEKIGQLFMVQAYSNKGKKHQKKIASLVKKHHVGGLIFMQGTPERQAVLNNYFQKKAKTPLLVGFDGEWGLNMRLKNTFRYPWNMTLGAVENNQLIEQFGKRLGIHCKRMGIHINFAPVVDINTNPENPIIGNRSFGENKVRVTQKAIAFVKGMQEVGVMANAKHFPGHGDTAADSHKTLPQLTFDLKRLQEVEMYPYPELFKNGLTSVMAAHLSVPALEPDPTVPTSISYKVITELLQQKMGFKGLVFTDALNMKGAANYAQPGDIDLAAFLAGNDMLLISEDIGAAVKKIKHALKKKTLTMERLNHSVEKILKAKYWAGLHSYKPIILENLQSDLNSKQDTVLRDKLVEKSITLLKNKEGVFPIRELTKTKIAYVKLGEAAHQTFLDRLNSYAEVIEIQGDKMTLLSKLNSFDKVIVGYHTSDTSPWKTYRFSEEDLELLALIAAKKEVFLHIFASPYSLLQIPSFENIEAILVAYQNNETAQDIAAQMLFGALETQGKLPVSIGNDFKEGTGLSSVNLMRLGYAVPEAVGMNSVKLQKIDSILQLVVKEKMAPGAQVLVARHGKVVYQRNVGYHTYEKEKMVQGTDVYDLASLTKILGALPLIMRAEETGMLSLDTSLEALLKHYKGTNKDTLTVKQLLSHTARLKAWIPFYLKTLDSVSHRPLQKYYRNKPNESYTIEVAKDLYLRTDYRDSLYLELRNVEQRSMPGYQYSGLPFFIFNTYLEENLSSGMKETLHADFFSQLGANTLGYHPLERMSKEKIIPSEQDDYFRYQKLQGYVHDMGAAMLGGVSGNAGLFGNANDVAKVMQMFLQEGIYGGHRYLEAKTLNKFNKRHFEKDAVRRGLGFDKPQIDTEVKSTCGCVSDNSFGHSGFTGTFAWADPDSGLLYVFLSNRTYPTMENNKLGEEDIRTKIQQLAEEAITD
jgi:beta-N-acetylhexosaminidase